MADRRPLVSLSSGLISELPAGDRIAGLRLGIEVQAWDADLDALAALTTPATTLAGAAQKSANLSDLASAATARTNLGLGIGVNVQAWDADLDAFALKTAPTGAVVGTTDSQALTNKTIVAGSNTISGITTSMFAANVVDTDSTLAANSSTRLVAQSAVKSYVDNLITGLKWKPAVRVLSTVAGTLATSFAAGQVMDGATLVAGNRIGLKDQATGSQNGLYTVNPSGAPTRALDADTSAEIAGCTFMVEEGTVNHDTQWTCTNNEDVVLGTDAIAFAQIAGAGTYSAGFGLTLTGNQFAITDPELVALAGLTSAADKLGYFTGSGTAALADLTSVARTLIAQTTQALMRTTGLGLGTSSTVDTGTSGTKVPLLDGVNTWSGTQTFSAAGGLGADTIVLSNATAQWIKWVGSGSGAPTLSTRSTGVKLLLDPVLTPANGQADTAIGVSANGSAGSLWFGLPSSSQQFDFYAGATALMTLLGTGVLSVGGSNVLLASSIGSSVQAWDADLDALAGITWSVGAASDLPFRNSPGGSWSKTTIGATGGSLITAPTPASARSTLVLGTAALEDSGTSGHTLGFLDGANTWSANNIFQSTATGATVNPILTLSRSKSSSSANDLGGALRYQHVDAAGTVVNIGQIDSQVTDPTVGAVNSRLRLVSTQAGAFTVKAYVGAGLYTISESDQGSNTINATTLYEAGTSLASKYVALTLLGTSGHTIPYLDGANTWSGIQTFTANPSFQSTTVGPATISPLLDLYRNIASIAAGQLIGGFNFTGPDSGGTKTTYGRMFGVVTDPTDTAETASLRFQTTQAGTLASRMSIGAGLYTNSASGGDQGADTINATTLYEAGTSLTSKYGQLGAANTWSGVNLFSSTAAASGAVGPIVGAYRNSPTVAAGNSIGAFSVYGNNSLIVQTRYASFVGVIDDPTSTAETAHIAFQTTQAGTNANRMHLGLGLYTNNQTDQGSNTISAATFYEGGTTLAGTYASLDLYRRLTADATGSNANTAQPWFPTTGGVTLLATTLYEFEGQLILNRTAGTTSHTISILFGGTATLTDIGYVATVGPGATNVLATLQSLQSAAATAIVLTAANTSATEFVTITVKGMVSVNAGGTFIPQFKYSAAPGGAPTVLKNSFFKLTKLGVNTSDHFGTWA